VQPARHWRFYCWAAKISAIFASNLASSEKLRSDSADDAEITNICWPASTSAETGDGRKSLHGGRFEYNHRWGSRERLSMSFEDGSVVHRPATWTDTVAGQGANCEAISTCLDCVFIEPGLCTMRSCVPSIETAAVSFSCSQCSVRNRVTIPGL